MSANRSPSPDLAARERSRSVRETAQMKVLRSEELFGAADRVLLLHRGQTYCLSLTRLGKLILTK